MTVVRFQTARCGADDFKDILAAVIEVRIDQVGERDDHVDFLGSGFDATGGLDGFDGGAIGTEWKGYDGTGEDGAVGFFGVVDGGVVQEVADEFDPAAVDADGGEAVFDGFGDDAADVGFGGVGFEECVVDDSGELGGGQFCLFLLG